MKSLEAYTTEELRDELKRRAREEKEKKASVPRCRNCKHCLERDAGFVKWYLCGARTYKLRGYDQPYAISLSKRACEKWVDRGNASIVKVDGNHKPIPNQSTFDEMANRFNESLITNR